MSPKAMAGAFPAGGRWAGAGWAGAVLWQSPAPYLGMVQVHPVHGELLGILQEVDLSFPGGHSPAERQRGGHMAGCPRGVGQLSCAVPSRGSPVGLVQLHDALLQLSCLVGGEAQLAHVVAHVLLSVMVTQLGLDGVGAQQGVGDKGAGQAPCDDVGTELQAQVVSTGGADSQSGAGQQPGAVQEGIYCPPGQAGALQEGIWCSPGQAEALQEGGFCTMQQSGAPWEEIWCPLGQARIPWQGGLGSSPGDVLCELGRVWRVELHSEGKVPGPTWGGERAVQDSTHGAAQRAQEHLCVH